MWRAGAAWTSTLGRGGAKEKSVREGVGERERETMSYPNEHVAAKTLSSCSPSEANEHVDSVRRSRRTSPRMRGVIHTTKVKQSRTITDKTGRPRVPVLLCYLIGASKSRGIYVDWYVIIGGLARILLVTFFALIASSSSRHHSCSISIAR